MRAVGGSEGPGVSFAGYIREVHSVGVGRDRVSVEYAHDNTTDWGITNWCEKPV